MVEAEIRSRIGPIFCALAAEIVRITFAPPVREWLPSAFLCACCVALGASRCFLGAAEVFAKCS